jgi:hypothetical protein
MPSIQQTLQKIDIADWKEIPVEYGRYRLAVRVPPGCDILTMREIAVLSDPRAAFEEALSRPIRRSSGRKENRRWISPRR